MKPGLFKVPAKKRSGSESLLCISSHASIENEEPVLWFWYY